MPGTDVFDLKGNLHVICYASKEKKSQSSFHKSYSLLKYSSCNKIIKQTKVKTAVFGGSDVMCL